MEYIFKITEDGSHTLYLPGLNEYYHSVYGAIQESQHVFIRNGLKTSNKQHADVLEIGFGTGLNAILTWQEARLNNMAVYYETIERYPLQIALAEKMNYPEQLSIDKTVFDILHSSEWGEGISVNSFFRFKKRKEDIRACRFDRFFDVIYFDAFAPEVQPELWSLNIMQKCYSSLRSGGILVTYCAKGMVKRNLQKAGFVVEKLPGPPGKREIIKGIVA